MICVVRHAPGLCHLTEQVFVVSPQEQYELVYRTIKVLFERYLQFMDAQTSRNEVSDQKHYNGNV